MTRFAPARLWARFRDFCRGLDYAGALFREPITSAGAAAAIRGRVANRAGMFLDTVERAIFAHTGSPYHPLLWAAGYDLSRIRTLVGQQGVDATLRRLADDGVYVTIEEFKGIHEARRGPRSFRFGPADFHNPLAQPGMRVSSGGTRSSGIVMTATTAMVRLTAEHLALTLAAHGLEGLPVAVWFTQTQGVGLNFVLCFSVTGNVPVLWVKQLPHRYGSAEEPYVQLLGVKAGARLHGVRLPEDTYVPVGREAAILPWVAQGGGRRYVIFTTASRALRLALAAKSAHTSLAGVTFLVGSEPLTPAKLAAIEAAGARAVPRFGFVELGHNAAYGCASAAGPDDMHICSDAAAVIQRRRPVDQSGSAVDALLFTSLRSDGGRVLLNMESGDYGRMTRRRCGCPLEALGWTDHLAEVRSFEKLTPEGGTFLGSKLIELFEEVLPPRFGGDLTDYQLLEHEDGEGFTRLTVLVHPRLGAVDEAAILDCVQRALEDEAEVARVFTQAGTLRVRRAAPMLTKAGKLMTLHRLAAGGGR